MPLFPSGEKNKKYNNAKETTTCLTKLTNYQMV